MMFLALADNSIQLVPDGTLFLHIALIILMVFVLNITLFRPINKVLAERERRTRGRSGEAQDILSRVESGLRQYETSLREARLEGYHLLEAQRAEAMNARQTLLGALREELRGLVEEQKSSIQRQTDTARNALAGDAQRIAAEISNQVLRRAASR
jgi:F-type H+-transporting ATPase subunit b